MNFVNLSPSKIGLTPLQNVSRIIVQQEVDLPGVLVGLGTRNVYRILDETEKLIYYAVEDASCLGGHSNKPNRQYTIRISDTSGLQVILIESEGDCCSAHHATVQHPAGTTIGTVNQECIVTCLDPAFYVSGPANELLFEIDSPFCPGYWCKNEDFDILANDHVTKIGLIRKTLLGCCERTYRYHTDRFETTFPPDLPVQHKACILAAVFAIDFKFFEYSRNYRYEGRGGE